MANPYYDHTTFPAPNSAGSSSAMRTELDLIEQGFDKLPSFAGNANKLIAVNSAENALAPVSGNVVLPGNLTVTGDTTLGDAAGDALVIYSSAVTWSNDPTHSGNHTFSGNLTVQGSTTLGDAAGDGLTIASSAITWSNDPTHSGSHTFSAITINGATTFANVNPTLNAGTANGVLYLDGSKVATSGSALTFDGTTLGSSALNITGNTTLGDASTDTVQVNGYMGVGGAGSSGIGIYQRGTALTGSTQNGIYAEPTFSSAATNSGTVLGAEPKTAAASFTLANLYGVRSRNVTLGSGSAVTAHHGVYVEDLTNATNNFGITSLVSSGANKWNIYASGTAANYFAGSVGVGTTTTSEGKVHVIVPNVGDKVLSLQRSGSARFDFTAGIAAVTGDALQINDSSANNYLTLRSGNVGIGASSPAAKLEVAVGDNGGVNIEQTGASQTGYLNWRDSDGTLSGRISYDHGSDAMRFATSATERLRIDSSGNLGIGTSSPGAKLDVDGVIRSQGSTGASSPRINLLSSGFWTWGIYGDGNTLKFQNDANDRLTLDSSGNLGIGTTSPGVRLDAVGVMRSTFNSTSNGGPESHGLELRQSTTSTKALIAGYSTSGNQTGAYIQAVNFGTAYENLVIQPQGGNLGLGVTPSAWGTSQRAIDIGYSGALKSSTGGSSVVSITNNAYYTTAWTYKVTGLSAALYDLRDTGEHRWYTAPSGTAGNAITFTERASISATEFVVNNPGEDYDFRVESDTNTHALFVEGSSGNVGIWNSTPTQARFVVLNTTASLDTTYIDASFNSSGRGLVISANTRTTADNAIATFESINRANATTLATTVAGNVGIGGKVNPANGVSTLCIFNGTAPTGSVANGIVLYAEDVSSSSELKVRDEAGNVTTLSPHNFSLIPEGPSEDMAWAYYSEKGGKRINVDMLKLARMVEKLTGEKIVYED